MRKFPKGLFEKLNNLAIKYHKVKSEFDKKTEEVYGIHYSDVDDDWLIDSIDKSFIITPTHIIKHMEENAKNRRR